MLAFMRYGDVLGTYWTDTAARRDLMDIELLPGHIDTSKILVANIVAAPELGFFDEAFRFKDPFSGWLWLAILGVVLISGFIDWTLEFRTTSQSRGHSTHWRDLGGSLYEYSAGVLWGGFQEPKSRASAVFQVFIGFMVLIIVAGYTGTGTGTGQVQAQVQVQVQVQVPHARSDAATPIARRHRALVRTACAQPTSPPSSRRRPV